LMVETRVFFTSISVHPFVVHFDEEWAQHLSALSDHIRQLSNHIGVLGRRLPFSSMVDGRADGRPLEFRGEAGEQGSCSPI
jgi:hypothetical protein